MLTYPWIKLNAVLTAIMWSVIGIAFFVSQAVAQEDGPVGEGLWIVPPEHVIVCPGYVNPANGPDPNHCSYIQDQWGPYPTEERCLARINQMGETFPVVMTMTSGLPHWGLTIAQCDKLGDEI